MSGTIDGLWVADLAAAGLFAHPSARAEVVERLGLPGSADPARVLLSRVLGGFEHEAIVSRGLDIGHASWRGVPVSWRSPVQDARALDQPAGEAWLSRFTGGLLTTCGPFGIGPAHSGQGLHGDFSHRPATRVTATTSHETSCDRTIITGAIEAARIFGPSVTIERTITSTAFPTGATLTITDEIHNAGPGDAHVAMLYHLNFGAPTITPGTRIAVGAGRWSVRESIQEAPDPGTMPATTERIVEAVFDHHDLAVDADGWARASIRRQSSPLEIEVAWRPAGLPYFYQWVYPTRRRWALALEPACAPLFGAARDAPCAGAPAVSPGDHRRHEIMVTIREAAS